MPGASQLIPPWQVRLRSARIGSAAPNQKNGFVYWRLDSSSQIICVGDGGVENCSRNVQKANKNEEYLAWLALFGGAVGDEAIYSVVLQNHTNHQIPPDSYVV